MAEALFEMRELQLGASVDVPAREAPGGRQAPRVALRRDGTPAVRSMRARLVFEDDDLTAESPSGMVIAEVRVGVEWDGVLPDMLKAASITGMSGVVAREMLGREPAGIPLLVFLSSDPLEGT